MSIAHQLVPHHQAPATPLKYHPLADLFPMMTDEELAGLTADIKEHGQRDPIIIFEDKILDGRNRYRACTSLGLTVKSRQWDGQGSAQAFVVSHNLHRRHLNESQRAMIAARIANATRGARTDLKSKLPANLQEVITVPEAAKLVNVSERSVFSARNVLAKASPEEIAAVESGKASVGSLDKQIQKNVPPAQRKAMAKNPHQARAESFQANARLWRELREALERVTGLPRAADMVPIVRSHDRANLTDTKLLPAIQWLTEFSDAWTSPDAEANSGRKDRSPRKAKEASASEGTEGSAAEEGGQIRAGRGDALRQGEGEDRGGRGNGSWREDHADAGSSG